MDPHSALFFLLLLVVLAAVLYVGILIIDKTVPDPQIRMPLKILLGVVLIVILIWRLLPLLPG
jgi:hypothetical protein